MTQNFGTNVEQAAAWDPGMMDPGMSIDEPVEEKKSPWPWLGAGLAAVAVVCFTAVKILKKRRAKAAAEGEDEDF